MEITKDFLEGRINSVREQGVKAANIVQQAIGAELALRETLAELEAESETSAVAGSATMQLDAEQEKDDAEE